MRCYIVTYDPSLLDFIQSFIKYLFKRNLFNKIEIHASTRLKSEIWWRNAFELQEKIEVNFYDDTWALDFSAYKKIIQKHCISCSFEGALIMNDTFFSKHYSFRSFNEVVGYAKIAERAKGKYYSGPFRHSEFFTSNNTPVQFVASYIFYVSYQASCIFSNSFERIDEFMNENTDLIELYHQYLREINYPPDIQEAKLKAFSMERIFTQTIIDNSGCIWCTHFGIRSRVLFYMERTALKIISVFRR